MNQRFEGRNETTVVRISAVPIANGADIVIDGGSTCV
jgi:hypothetical protein